MTEEEQNTILKFIHLTCGMRAKDAVEFTNKTLEDSHRTNQQSFWRFIQELAGEYAKDQSSDLRNEGAKSLAAEIAELPIYLPYV